MKTFGATTLPDEQREALHKAKRLEWISIAYTVVAVALIYAVMGSSQAMKAAWIEDMLAFLPPIAFLIAARAARHDPDHDNPYGKHRAVGAAHLAAAVALLAMGLFLVADSAMTLFTAEHPTIGTLNIFGYTVWQGWLMIGALIATGIPNVLLGRAKMKLAEPLHDKVLFADADMNKADWMTAFAAVVGVTGIGLGLWWLDSAVAILIGADIVKDGFSNLRGATGDLMDRQARTHDDKDEHPLVTQVREVVDGLAWVAAAQVRMRDEGHVFHTEVFVVPHAEPTLELLESAQKVASSLDWKLDDLVIIPVRELPRREE